MIAIQNPYNKTVRAVYCHWDGYLEHNGSILHKHYSQSPKVNNLIALGGLSSLRAEIGEKHTFSSLDLPKAERAAHEEAVKDMCTFYGRDRGETGQEFKVFPTLKQAEDYFEGSWCEYFYVFKYSKADDYQSGEWHYKTRGGRWKKLAPALKRCDKADMA
jgi:hypothetical protein